MTARLFEVTQPLPRVKAKEEKERVQIRRKRPVKAHKAKIVETKGPGKKHTRTLAHGEIIEYIRIHLEVLFTMAIPSAERYHPYRLKNIRDMIREDIQPWVRRYSTNKHYKLMPCQVSRALLTMSRRNLYFRIDGDVVQMLRKNEMLTVHHELVRPN